METLQCQRVGSVIDWVQRWLSKISSNPGCPDWRFILVSASDLAPSSTRRPSAGVWNLRMFLSFMFSNGSMGFRMNLIKNIPRPVEVKGSANGLFSFVLIFHRNSN